MSVLHRSGIQALAAGLALLTLVTGCSGSVKPTANTAAKQVTLTVQTWPGISVEVLANVNTEFMAKHPNVKVSLKEGTGKVPGPSVDASYLDGVDVVFTSEGGATLLAGSRLLKDLSAVKSPQLNDAVAGIFGDLGVVDGVRHALPVEIAPSLILIYEQAITKAGLKVPTPDWTWQEFQQALTATKDAGSTNQVTVQAMLEPFLRGYGGQLYDGDKQQFVFDSAQAKQALEALQPFVRNSLFVSGLGPMIKAGPGPGGGGPAFMAFGGSVILRGGQSQALPYPKGPKGRPSPATATVAAVSAASPNADTATEYVKALLNDPAEQLVLAKGGIRPVSNDAKALAAWQQSVGDQMARTVEAALPDVYIARAIPNQADVVTGLMPYLNGTAALDPTVSSLMARLAK